MAMPALIELFRGMLSVGWFPCPLLELLAILKLAWLNLWTLLMAFASLRWPVTPEMADSLMIS